MLNSLDIKLFINVTSIKHEIEQYKTFYVHSH